MSKKPRIVWDVTSTTPSNQRWFRIHVLQTVKCATWDDNVGYTVTNESKWTDALDAAESKEVSKP